MYLTKGDYKELYYCIIDQHLLDKYKEYNHYINSLYNMFVIYPLFSDKYDIEISSKYMEKVIRFVTRYNINDEIINYNLVDVVGTKIANTDMFFYSIYSIIEPKEMVRISLKEYITSFYNLLLSNFNHWNKWYTEDLMLDKYKNIKIDNFKKLLEYLVKANINNIANREDFSIRYTILAIIIADIYVNNKEYSNIDMYLNNSDYYMNKLVLNGYMSGISYTYDFVNWDYIKNLFNNMDSFIKDNSKRKIK